MRRAFLFMFVIVIAAAACSADSAPAPTATASDFPQLDQILVDTRRLATTAGDLHPKEALVVRTTVWRYWNQPPTSDPERNREVYGIVVSGKFVNCNGCGYTYEKLAFIWDPKLSTVTDVGYGAAPDLNSQGTVFRLPI